MAKSKRSVSYYDRPAHKRIAQRIFDGLLSSAALYFLTPFLLKSLAPLAGKVAPYNEQPSAPPSPAGS